MRIVGINIPDNKKIAISLTYIYGVGNSLARRILDAVKIDPNKHAKDVTSDEANRLHDFIDKHFKVEGELRQLIKQNINLLKEMQTYRGTRHIRHLPVRGQR